MLFHFPNLYKITLKEFVAHRCVRVARGPEEAVQVHSNPWPKTAPSEAEGFGFCFLQCGSFLFLKGVELEARWEHRMHT